MNNNLKGIILKIEDRLSEDDRARLHFYIGDNVPRPVRDDLTLCGTLCLIQCLFERNYVNDEDLTLLINAFETIRCIDAAKLLKEYRGQAQSNADERKSSYSLMLVLPEKSVLSFRSGDDDHAAMADAALLDRISFGQRRSSEVEHLQLEPTNVFATRAMSSFSVFSTMKRCSASSSTKIHLVWFFALFIVILVGMTIASTRWVFLKTPTKIEEIIYLQQQRANNKTIDQLKEVILKDNATIFKLHEEIASNANAKDPQAHWQEGTTCTCDPWCRGSGKLYGVCGDGPTCLCRDQPITKATSAEGCSCDSWCRLRGHQNGGICGDGYTCICSS